MSKQGWYGVDLDGTLARWDHFVPASEIGEPIPAMVDRVKAWLAAGEEVRIVTARAGWPDCIPYVQEFSRKVFGVVLPVTASKDDAMIELWDDRAVQVIRNLGIPVIEGAALNGDPGTGFEPRVINGVDMGPFECGNCRFFNGTNACNQETMMAVSTRPRHPDGTVEVFAPDCCEYVARTGKAVDTRGLFAYPVDMLRRALIQARIFRRLQRTNLSPARKSELLERMTAEAFATVAAPSANEWRELWEDGGPAPQSKE